MKKLSLFALAAAGLFLGACSNDDAVKEVAQAPQDFADGAFIGLSLQLPKADSYTRANDDLTNGTEEEFAVKNATLYIFKLDKTSTANPDEAATFVAKVSIGNKYEKDTQGGIDPDNWGVQEDVDDTKITSTYNEATLIPNDLASEMKADVANKYYAYVIINHNGQITAPTEDVTTFKQFSDQTFNQIGADIAAEQNIWETGLLMTNAPISSVKGGDEAPAATAKYSTLVELDNTQIYGSKTQAEKNPAACVYVERAAVKITVEDNRPAGDKQIGGLDATIAGWQVINNEPTYYNTRHINNDGTAAEDWGPYFNADWTAKNTTYRFVSLFKFEPTLPTGATHTTGYRTYFAKDVQYNANAALANTVASETRPWIAVGKDKHAYTTENTFDVEHQTWRNTTMVTLKVQIGDGTKGFYTVGKGGQTMYVDDADMTATDAKSGLQKALDVIENIIKADNDVAMSLAALRQKIADNNPLQEVKSGLTLTATAPTAGKTGVEFAVALDYTLAGAPYASFAGTGEADLKTALETNIKKVIYANGTDATKGYSDAVLLSFYKGGVSYYNVRIKHFGDAETPWSATGSYIAGGGTNVNEIYFGTKASETVTAEKKAQGQKNFLGRYGVVRDNWYKLDVTKIGKIGDAQPVDPSTVTPDTPDDEIENYISVHVHIVPWVLRSQVVQL